MKQGFFLFLICFLGLLSDEAQVLSQTSEIAIPFSPLVGTADRSDKKFPFTNTPFAYRALNDQVTRLEPAPVPFALPLPNTLIISPGVYSFQGNVYRLKEAGLYRFYLVGKEYQQRIIFDGNIKALLSALSWISAHGDIDNALTQDQLETKALMYKLIVSCGVISYFANEVLTKNGVRSRVVSTVTLDDWNNYDNGHSMIEVFFPDTQAWVLYDLDNGYFFTDANDKPLNLLDFFYAAQTGRFKMIPITNQRAFDIRTTIAFFTEEYMGSLKDWYKHAIQVLYQSSYYFCVDTPENRKKFEEAYIGTQYLTADEYRKKYYENR
jgi:hypothetical protein